MAKGGAPGNRISWQTKSGQNNIVSYKVVQDFLFCVIPLFEGNISLFCLGEAEVFKSRGNNEAQKNLVMRSPLVAVEFLKSRGKS